MLSTKLFSNKSQLSNAIFTNAKESALKQDLDVFQIVPQTFL